MRPCLQIRRLLLLLVVFCLTGINYRQSATPDEPLGRVPTSQRSRGDKSFSSRVTPSYQVASPRTSENESTHSIFDPDRYSSRDERSSGASREFQACGPQLASGRTGFALSLAFWDQQTWACGNLLGLQSWAASLSMVVVEPFLVDTKFHISSRDIKPSDLAMSTLYDMQYWNNYSVKNEYAPTVTWECFLQKAPTHLILVYLKTTTGKCNLKELRSNTLMLMDLGFHITRELCISTVVGHRLSLSQFNIKILGNLSAPDVTIVFQEWSQYQAGDNLDLQEVQLPNALRYHLPLKPAVGVNNDADAYISRYLWKDFVAVLFRFEWLDMYRGDSDYKKTLLPCLNRTLKYVMAAKAKSLNMSVFLGMDIGKYGSITMTAHRAKATYNVVEDFIKTLYSDFEMTISKWEQTFEDISQTRVRGYIAFLQKTIATRARCLLLIGGGSFQKQALERYKDLHVKSEWCYLTTSSKGSISQSTFS